MENKKQFENLSKFEKRDVELFRSSDQHNTAIYFTDVDDSQRENAKSFFEVLRFGLHGGDHQMYIRFPNTDYFVEMIGGGIGSAHGDMMIAKGKNIHDTHGFKGEFAIYSHGNNLLVSFGNFPRFNFMTKIAEYNKGNQYNNNYPNENFANFKEIEKALSMKYLKVSESIRKIEYCYKTKGETPKYFVVDYPAYNFKYSNHRFFVIENDISKEYEIKNFVRYKDGGTTIITVIDENFTEHTFFSPTSLPEKVLCEKWDEIELVVASETEKLKIAKLLELELEQTINDDYLLN